MIFASGVSNSKSTVQADYDREFELLRRITSENEHKEFVYFSTCSIDDPSESKSAYILHKERVEESIQANLKKYLIFRVSNLVGKSDNPHTILNYITNNIRNQVHFNLWVNATRNLIDVDDFFKIVNHILRNNLFSNRVVNIANPQNYQVQQIVAETEQYYNTKGNYDLIPKGCNFNINISDIAPYFDELQLDFGQDYLKKLLAKYY